jgi:transcription elongation factor Elf1
MEYVCKKCPICGHEFIVLKKVEDKAIYCTLECLLFAQRRVKKEKVSSFISA